MKANFIKTIAIFLSICIIFSLLPSNSIKASEFIEDNFQYKVVRNDDDMCIVMTDDDGNGNQAYASLDKNTNEIIYQVVEEPEKKVLGIQFKKEKKEEYSVKIENSNDEEFNAVLTSKSTGKKFKIDKKSKSKVKAQMSIPIGVALGAAAAALLKALLATAAVIVVGGVTYYAASKVVSRIREQKQYDYYMARIEKGDVWIGNAFLDYSSALAWVLGGNDVFCRTEQHAKTIAKEAGQGFARGPENDCESSPKYYWHYHPKYPSYENRFAVKAHCFY